MGATMDTGASRLKCPLTASDRAFPEESSPRSGQLPGGPGGRTNDVTARKWALGRRYAAFAAAQLSGDKTDVPLFARPAHVPTRDELGFSLRQLRPNPNRPIAGAGESDGQEAVRRKPRV